MSKDFKHTFRILEDYGRNNPFSVPDGYFEGFEKQILQKIHTPKQTHTFQKGNTFKNPVRLWQFLSIAASVLLIVSFATWKLFYTNDSNQKKHEFSKQIHIKFEKSFPQHQTINGISLQYSEDITSLNFKISVGDSYSHKELLNIISSQHLSPVVSQQIIQKSEQFCKNESYNLQNQHVENNEIHKPALAFNNSETNKQQPQSVQNQPVPFVNIVQEDIHLSNNQVPQKPVIFEQNNVKENIHRTDKINLNEIDFPEKICMEQAFWLDAGNEISGLTYKWSTGDSGRKLYITHSGYYDVTISQDNQLSNFITLKTFVDIKPNPGKVTESFRVLCSGETLEVTPKISSPEIYQYQWIPGKKSELTKVISEPGLYIFQILGCKTYNDSIFVVKDHCEIRVPNSITPNNDGINDNFYIFGLESQAPVSLNIYNRKGFMVFSTSNYQNNWSAENQPDGTYYYILKFRDGVEKHGTITVLR